MSKEYNAFYYELTGDEIPLIPLEVTNGEETKALSATKYHLGKSGIYEYEGKLWQIEKEGLYRFFDEEQEQVRQHCYFEHDVQAIIFSLAKCNEYCGRSSTALDAFTVFSRLLKENEAGASVEELVLSLFTHLFGIPHRLIYLYSMTENCTLFKLLEIWDKQKNAWVLYWLDNNAYLGETGMKRTFLTVFSELAKGNFDRLAKRYLPYREIKSDFLAEKGLLDLVNRGLQDSSYFSELVKEKKIIPFLAADGDVLLRLYAHTSFTSFFSEYNPEKFDVIGDENLFYKVKFFDDAYIKDDIYAPQLYITHNGITRIY